MGVNLKCENWHSDPPGGLNKLGWGNSVFKIEGGGGPSYLKQTTDSEFPRTFDVIPKTVANINRPKIQG